jgi:hypothetical protein
LAVLEWPKESLDAVYLFKAGKKIPFGFQGLSFEKSLWLHTSQFWLKIGIGFCPKVQGEFLV